MPLTYGMTFGKKSNERPNYKKKKQKLKPQPGRRKQLQKEDVLVAKISLLAGVKSVRKRRGAVKRHEDFVVLKRASYLNESILRNIRAEEGILQSFGHLVIWILRPKFKKFIIWGENKKKLTEHGSESTILSALYHYGLVYGFNRIKDAAVQPSRQHTIPEDIQEEHFPSLCVVPTEASLEDNKNVQF
ncbi:uncharacterized protein LOC135691009 [Rhopilema esculentum]|uniref:uncharacterized protein LOC135691009 n=1 Tax=Rhopilema esculentum TaxID=499914 RepID=UPI0031DCC3E0|eukprot:gene2921-1163_t